MTYLEIARRAITRQKVAQAVAEPVAVPSSPPALDDYMAIFYERATICEFDGGLDRVNAEREAMRQIFFTHLGGPKKHPKPNNLVKEGSFAISTPRRPSSQAGD